MRRQIIGYLLLVVPLVIGGNARAADNGIYVGAALSQSSIETDNDFFGFGFEDDETAWKLIGGIRPFDALAFEANYVDFGSIVVDQQAADGFRAEFESRAIDAFAVGFLGGPLIEGFGKIGVIAWDAESALSGGLGNVDLRDDDSGVDLAIGAGLQASFTSLALRLEYERFEIADTDSVELWSLGVTWTFL